MSFFHSVSSQPQEGDLYIYQAEDSYYDTTFDLWESYIFREYKDGLLLFTDANSDYVIVTLSEFDELRRLRFLVKYGTVTDV